MTMGLNIYLKCVIYEILLQNLKIKTVDGLKCQNLFGVNCF